MTRVLLIVVDANWRWAHPANLGYSRTKTWIAVVMSGHQDCSSSKEELYITLSVSVETPNKS